MDNLGFGLSVTLAGLGIVFGLLAVLWLLLSLALRLDRRGAVAAELGPDEGPSRAPAESPASIAPDGDAPLDPRLVAAITVAVVRHTEALRRRAAPSMRSHLPGSLLFASHWVAAGRTRQSQPWRRRAR
jgi:Na+-transporting methylmalonyl-CoA/oxaloacetate decarboxylase gamma subunit